MGASRESYNIRRRLKYRKTFKDKLYFIVLMIRKLLFNKYYRKLILIDNIIQPFNKSIGCKIFNHKFKHDDEYPEYFCEKCWERITEQEYNSFIRIKKLQRIKNKL